MSSSSSSSFDTYVERMQSFDLDVQVKRNHRKRLQPLLHFLRSSKDQLEAVGDAAERQRSEWRRCEARLATLDAELLDAVVASAEAGEDTAPSSRKLLAACYVDPLTLLHGKALYGRLLKEVGARGGRTLQLIVASATLDDLELVRARWSRAHGDYAIILAADAIHEEVQKWNEQHCRDRKEAHCSAFRFGDGEFVLAFAFCAEKSHAEGHKEALAKALLASIQQVATRRLLEEFPFKKLQAREGPCSCWEERGGCWRGLLVPGRSPLRRSRGAGPGAGGPGCSSGLGLGRLGAAGPALSIGVSTLSTCVPEGKNQEDPISRLHQLYKHAESVLEQGKRPFKAGDEPKGVWWVAGEHELEEIQKPAALFKNSTEVRAAGTLLANSAGKRAPMGPKGPLPVPMQLLEGGTLSVDAEHRGLVEEEAAVPPLLQFLESGSPVAKERAAGALKYLSAKSPENKVLVAQEGAVPLLVRLLEDGTPGAKEQAATALRNLAVDAANKVLIVREGALPPLVRLLESGRPAAKEQAAGALWNLSANNAENKVVVAQSGAVPALVRVLEEGTPGAKEKAAGALLNLSVNGENRMLVAQNGAVPMLVRLLADGTPTARENAAGALLNLSASSGGQNQALIGRLGAVPPLVRLLEDGTPAAKEQAAGALWNLSAKSAANKVLIGQSGGVTLLLQLLETGTPAAKENAAGALKSLSANSAEFKVLMGQQGAVPLLTRLLEDGTPAAKEQATGALKLLGHGHKC